MKEKLLQWVSPFIRIPVTGFDISDRTVKYLRFSSRGDLSFDIFGEIEIPEGTIEKGEIKKEGVLTELFSSWAAREKKQLRSPLVAVSLPEEKSFLRVIQIPKVEQEKVGNAIRWEIEGNIPLPPDELLYDYEIVEPLEDHLDHLDVVIVAFPRSIVDSYLRVLDHARLQPATLELESQAIIRAVIPVLRDPTGSIVVDMGRTRTSFIIFAGGAIIFTSTIELGGNVFEKNIANTFHVGSEEALALKKNIGLNKRADGGRMFAALAPPLSVLAETLRGAMEYYRGYSQHRHGADKEIDKIILSGGDANLYGLDTYLASTLKVPVYVADPLGQVRDKLTTQLPPFTRRESLAFTTAIGLALRNIR
ncbi:MAG: hypothetical protein A3C07_01360 [Candidatus Sungbacteria bacterium RIFCSPHIGHO2_02_FULL_47_11]|uniref:SHS2 domain-containing protein n=1 Tax=Candidatus Sungbacteria bacterium RIFCSPHIGHO2_02_FULL_47_11 TaxID=1802270 RepID=A0A1G2KM74_9BACT|nr:MAG: hypothetical protein A3C07_01360 [Candidatus Sungbacteria bacterium RIFCSPHIGHO2_02_FULL_47_11]